MIAHLTRRINAPYRCSLKTLLFCINLDWKLSFLISKLIWTRSIFIPVVHKVNGKLQGFFHHEAMLHGEMSGVRAPLGAAGDLSEQALFLSLRIHIIDIVGNGKTRYFILHTPCRCGHRWSVSFSYEKKKWFKHHYYVIIKFFIWGYIQSI